MEAPEFIKILDEAKDLIEKGWHQGYFAQNADGRDVDSSDPNACAFCVLGAVFHAAGDKPAGLAYDALIAVSPGGMPAEFNDQPGRTKEEVLDLIDAAKEWIRERPR